MRQLINLWQRCLPFFAALVAASTLTQSSAEAQAVNPQLDGKIVYAANGVKSSTIYSINPDGTGAAKLFDAPEHTSDYVPSADGNVFAFVKNEGKAPGASVWSKDQGTGSYIWTTNADGSQSAKLTDDGGTDSHPALDAHGRKVVFNRFEDHSRHAYAVNTDHAGLVQITESPLSVGRQPVLNLQGDLIVFQGNLREWYRDVREWHYLSALYVVTADGKTGEQITETRDDLEGSDSQPAFSPDGQRVVFVSTRDGVTPDADSSQWTSEIYVMNRDGSAPTRLTHLNGLCGLPRFSPDGRSIVFQRKDKNKIAAKWEIWTMKANSSDLHCVIKGDMDYEAPYWVGLPEGD